MSFVPLSSIASVIRGVSFSKDEGQSVPSENFLPVIRAGSIQDTLLLDEGQIWVPKNKVKEHQKIRRDDIVMCTSSGSSALVGKCAKSDIDFEGSFGAFCAGIRPDKEKVSASYLYHFLSSPIFRNWTGTSSGANIKNIRISELAEFQTPLPPLAEQKRIATILDKADAIRRKRQQAIQLADEFLRATFLDMFGDPVTNPKGWEDSTLRNLIHLQGGFAFKSDGFSDSGIPVVKIGNANKVGFTTKEIAFIQPEKPEKLIQYELYPGDLLMSLTGTVGKDDYANVTEVTDDYEKYYLNQRVAKITIISGRITKTYLKYILAHPKIKNEITKNNRGVRQANLSNSDIYELNIPVPDFEGLNRFDQIVRCANAFIKDLNKCTNLNGNLCRSLSQKTFSGQL